MKKLIGIILIVTFFGNCQNNSDSNKRKNLEKITIFGLSSAKTPTIGDAVYTNPQKEIFFTEKKGRYSILLADGSTQVVDTSGDSLYQFKSTIKEVQTNSIISPLSLLPDAIVDIKVYPSQKSPNNDVAIFCGTNNSLDIEACEKSPLTKKMIDYALEKGNVHLFRYNLGASIIQKCDIYQKIIETNPAVFNVTYDTVISVSQGTQIANVLMERNKLSFKKHLKIVAPDNGILKELQDAAMNKEKFLFMLSPEYTDFLDGSEFYKRSGNQCSVFKTRADILTLALNTATSKTDLLMPNSSHTYCANPDLTWNYNSLNTSHYNMGDDDKYLYDVIIAILEGRAPKKDLFDPRDTGVLGLLTQLQNSSGVLTSFAVAPDGKSFIAYLTTSSGENIATITLGDRDEGGKVIVAGYEVGAIQFTDNGAVFTPKELSIGSTKFSYNPTTNQLVSTSNGNTLILNFNSGEVLLNGNLVSSFTATDKLQVNSISLPEIIAGNILIKDVKFDFQTFSLSGNYYSNLGKIPVVISLNEDKIFLDGAYYGKFSALVNLELINFEQQLMTQMPQSLKPYVDVVKNMKFNSAIVDPSGKLLVSLTYQIDSINSIDFIFELGIINGRPFLKTIPGTSTITIYPDANSSVLFTLDKLELFGGNEPEGYLKISTAVKYKTSGKLKDKVGKLVNTVFMLFLMNPELAVRKIADFAWNHKIQYDPIDHLVTLPNVIQNIWMFAPILGLTYIFSSDEISYELSVNLNGSLSLQYKNHILSMPPSGLNADGTGSLMTKIFFDIIPFLTADGRGNANVTMYSNDLSKSINIHASADISIDGKLLFLTLVGAKAELESLDATIFFNTKETESKGNISASVHVLGSLLGFITITDQKLKVNLQHLNKENYKMWIWRDRFDILSSATQTGDIYFSVLPGNVVIQSHNVTMSGRANVSANCDNGLVQISGGNGIYIHQKTIDCFSEGVIDMGYGRLQLWRTKWFDTSMEALDLRF